MFINQDEKQADERAAEFVIVMQKCMTLGFRKKNGVLLATRRFCKLKAQSRLQGIHKLEKRGRELS